MTISNHSSLGCNGKEIKGEDSPLQLEYFFQVTSNVTFETAGHMRWEPFRSEPDALLHVAVAEKLLPEQEM